MRGNYHSSDPSTQDALEILAPAVDYAWDEATPASSWGIQRILSAQACLIQRDKASKEEK